MHLLIEYKLFRMPHTSITQPYCNTRFYQGGLLTPFLYSLTIHYGHIEEIWWNFYVLKKITKPFTSYDHIEEIWWNFYVVKKSTNLLPLMNIERIWLNFYVVKKSPNLLPPIKEILELLCTE